MSRVKGGLNTKLHLAVYSCGSGLFITQQLYSSKLIEGISAEYLCADGSYDSDKIVSQDFTQRVIIHPREKIESTNITTKIFTRLDTCSKTLFYILNDVEVLQRGTQKKICIIIFGRYSD